MTLSICTFNVAHGRGLAESNWRGGSFTQRRKRLDRIASVIDYCDVVVLQEVDFCAPWTFGLLNQQKYLMERTDYSYSVRFLSHRFFVRLGMVIMSRHPLVDREVIELPQYSKREGLLGYSKHALACTVKAEKDFRLVGVHLDYRGRSVTVPAAEVLVDYALEQRLPVVLAGDFNSTPLSFPNPYDSHLTALDHLLMRGLFQHRPTVPNGCDMTHPTDDPRCVIDWILIPTEWRFLSYEAIDVKLSDHRPVKAQVSCF